MQKVLTNFMNNIEIQNKLYEDYSKNILIKIQNNYLLAIIYILLFNFKFYNRIKKSKFKFN